MYLKRLEIKGFKSFAENTELLLEPGINVIVGPNGCGKSNIADAIRWVLGESNVRHLRGQRNEDIIFNGTDKQRAQSLAMVDITIDNTSGELPLDYREITVGRRIFRNGESEYWLNKSKVRMKDIVNLFVGTGLGKRGYSLIGQGELEQVLNGQPFDRRLVLEEASGTIKYRQQRDAVQQRLANSRQDLQRVQDIMGEMEIHAAELAKKAARAEKHMELKEQFTTLDRQLIAAELKAHRQNLAEQNEQLVQHQTAEQTKGQDLATLQARLTRLEQEAGVSRMQLAELKDQSHQLEAQRGHSEAEIKLITERIKNLRERFDNTLLDADKNAHMLEGLNADLQKQQENLQAEQRLWHERQTALVQLNEEIMALETIISAAEKEFSQHSRQLFAEAQLGSQLKNQLLTSEDKHKQSLEKKARLQLRWEESQDKIKQAQEKQRRLQEQKQFSNRHLRDYQEKLEIIQQQYQAVAAQKESLENEELTLKRTIGDLENKLLSLQDLEKKFHGYSSGVKAILEAKARGEGNLHGIKDLMSRIIEVPAGMETALEAAVGKGLENIVTASMADAREAIYMLKRKGLGRVTFLPLDGLRVQKLDSRLVQELAAKEGVLGLASHLVSYDPQYEKAVEYLLGRVLLVSDLDKGMQVYRQLKLPLRIVSLDGEIINVSGAMTGGSSAVRNSLSPLKRKAASKKLQQQLTEHYARREQIHLNKQNVNAAAQAREAELKARRNQIAEVEFQIALIAQELDAVAVTLAAEQEENLLYQQDIAIQETYSSAFSKEIEQTQQQLAQHLKKNHHSTQTLEQKKADLEEKQRQHDILQERVCSRREQLEMKTRELEKLQKSLLQFTEVKESYEQSRDQAEKLQRRLQADIKSQQELRQKTQQTSLQQQEQIAAVQSAYAAQQEANRHYTQEIEALHEQYASSREQHQRLNEVVRSAEMRILRLEMEHAAAMEKWQEKYAGLNPTDYVKPMTSGEQRRYRQASENLKQEIELLGSVDLESINEYRDLNMRLEFLQQQSSDILEARTALEKLLGETEKVMAHNFRQFLLLANESFKRTCQEIFGGGEASLVLEKTDDYLAAGVDIEIKLPGKRSQPLNLLSGGERALTCIAFIFSLLRLRPAPFCLLDEIDAALDETNLGRFTGFLKNMAQEIQFIVITHRQSTIEAGSSLFGVTMPEKGVSAILSLNLEESINLAV